MSQSKATVNCKPDLVNLIASVMGEIIDPGSGESVPTVVPLPACTLVSFHTVTCIQTNTMPSALERFLADRNAPIVSLQIDEVFAQLR